MRPFIVFCLLITAFTANAQPSTASRQPGEKAIQLYEKEMGNQSHLYNGTDFKVLPVREQEHPYFLVDEFMPGSVRYRDQSYEPVDLLYDLASDNLHIEDGASKNEMELIKMGVASFTVQGHYFEQVTEAKDKGIVNGFYEILASGNTWVMVRHEKSLQHKQVGYESRPWYDVKERTYVRKDGQYFLITTKKSLFICFIDKKDAVRQHLRQKGLHFKKEREEFCKEAAVFYDSLQP